MANTYVLISSNVLGSNTATVTFSSIPATYTDLLVRIGARGDTFAQSTETFTLRINSNSGANYSQTRMINAGGSGTVSYDANTTSLAIVRGMTASTATANIFGNVEIYIPSYTSTQNRPIYIQGGGENNDTSSFYNLAEAGLFRNTSAITTLLFAPNNSTNFLAGSSFYLYGIKNS
jgi:hypothetical protein